MVDPTISIKLKWLVGSNLLFFISGLALRGSCSGTLVPGFSLSPGLQLYLYEYEVAVPVYCHSKVDFYSLGIFGIEFLLLMTIIQRKSFVNNTFSLLMLTQEVKEQLNGLLLTENSTKENKQVY